MIVDCHTHWGMMWEERDRSDPSQWLLHLDRHGVRRALLMGHASLFRADLCEGGNDTIACVARKAPDRLIPIGSAWPQMGKRGLDEIVRCIEELRVKGLKFHPWLQGFSTADPVLGQMCALAGEREIPVFFHDGTPCYSLPEQVAGLARRLPKTCFVLAHSGLLWSWRSALQAARLSNVWLCLCGPHLRAIELLCRQADPGRIVWGSDFGFGFADQIDYRLNLFLRARIADRLKSRILEINPKRLVEGC